MVCYKTKFDFFKNQVFWFFKKPIKLGFLKNQKWFSMEDKNKNHFWFSMKPFLFRV